MGIGYRIKEARENLGFTQTELGKMIGVTGSAITNYENETSHPKEPIMYKLIEALKVDANYLFQDCVKLPKEANDVTLAEYEHIKKYRLISIHSPDGAVVVDTVLDREYAIAEKLREQKEQIQKTNAEVVEEIIPRRILAYAYYGKIAAAGTSVEFSGMTEGIKSYPENDININADYVIGVSGDSMEPEYYDGDIVYVKKAEHLNVGEIGIFQKANSIYIKKVGENGLISLNSNYPGLTADDDRIIVLGKVLGKAEE